MKKEITRSIFGLLALFALALPTAVDLPAQCQRVGFVAASDMGCGARIVDLNSGQLLLAVSGAEALPAGKVFRFSAIPAVLPSGCLPETSPTVALTCVTDTLPCEASFTYAVSPQNAFRLFFEAKIYDPNTQKCRWTFSDGGTAEGRSVQYTFAQEGYYNVCLTLTDNNGCQTQQCRSIWVSATNPNACGYEVQLTAVGAKLHGQLIPSSASSPALQSVRWFLAKTGATLSNAPVFTTLLPGEGTYYICAQYETKNPKCVATRCQLVSVASSQCMQPQLAQLMANQMCPSFFAPVCGCNGITYPNECAAMAAGITQWWAGECGAPGGGNCAADLTTQSLSGTPANGYWVRFHNRSAGAYQAVQVDFGDGSPLWIGSAADTIIDHHYAKSGLYRVNLTVWRNNQCVSSVERIVATDAASWQADNSPALTDYVFPGDANGDRQANAYDLLQLGLGFTRTGAPRPFATTAWAPQFAPNWTAAASSPVNFKHADTDGNGVINEFDRAAIERNYAPIGAAETSTTDAGVPVWLRFAQDSIVINPQNPAPIVISADVKIGHIAAPVHQLYGLAFALKYPEFIGHDPEVLYSNNSFLGTFGDILLLTRDIYSRRQMDLGFARKNGQAVSGYGSLARVNFATDFVIIIDVIERTGALRVPFTVPVIGVRGINAQGQPLALRGAVLDTLWIILDQSVTNENHTPASTIEAIVYPNPTAGDVWVAVGNTTLERVEVFDMLGHLVENHRPTGVHTTRMETHGWRKGLYVLRIYTREGVAEKRLAVH
ncbi:MAG: PKD domain-containing protein [Saprospiraceae bacterium]|nr:PKD domain-containing protein [Saprospiraceae bacterium]MDW8229318.1 PKD domain-containing protein [Saprospiraceae bacterium]